MSGADTSVATPRLDTLLTEDGVLLDVRAPDASSLFLQAGLLLGRQQPSRPLFGIADALAARERLGSTALGHGVAIPHARLKKLATPLAAIVRLRQGLAFQAPDELPVRLFVVLLVPELAGPVHLDLLAGVAATLSDRATRERLMQAPSAAALLAAWRHAPDVEAPDAETRNHRR